MRAASGWMGCVVAATLLACSATPSGVPVTRPQERVVLIHGLGGGPAVFWLLSKELEKHGYDVVTIKYPSTKLPFAELVDHLGRVLDDCCPEDGGQTHFVTHSLGGILLRAHLANRPRTDLGRVVMLVPPNQGSEVADVLGGTWLTRLVLGPVVAELGTSADSAPKRLGPPDSEVGVLMGNRSWNPIGSLVIPGPDDGTVSVESARLEAMTDFRIVPGTHTFLMNRPDVAREVVYFLENGRFTLEDSQRPEEPRAPRTRDGSRGGG